MIEVFALASLALAAGVISFTSPCTVPLLPGYVSYVSGLAPERSSHPRRQVLLGSGLFVAGFTVVFSALGATASTLGFLLMGQTVVIERVAGVLIIVMGLFLAGVVRFGWMQRTVRVEPSRMARGPSGAFPLGMAFAAGWTPCIGPVLAGILAVAATEATLARGVGLLAVYSLGLGLPFVWLALGIARGRDRLSWLRRHSARIERVGGWVLVAMGVAMITGGWTLVMSRALAWFARLGWPPI